MPAPQLEAIAHARFQGPDQLALFNAGVVWFAAPSATGHGWADADLELRHRQISQRPMHSAHQARMLSTRFGPRLRGTRRRA